MDLPEDQDSAKPAAKAWIELTGAFNPAASTPTVNATGFVKTWVALRKDPWHVVAPFGTEEEAGNAKRKLGESYEVFYGAWKPSSNVFYVALRPSTPPLVAPATGKSGRRRS